MAPPHIVRLDLANCTKCQSVSTYLGILVFTELFHQTQSLVSLLWVLPRNNQIMLFSLPIATLPFPLYSYICLNFFNLILVGKKVVYTKATQHTYYHCWM